MTTELMVARAEIEKLRAELERMADELERCAKDCAEEEIRLEACINDMNNDNRELRAEVGRLRREVARLSGECVGNQEPDPPNPWQECTVDVGPEKEKDA
jgi:chromosome segregation ATPase